MNVITFSGESGNNEPALKSSKKNKQKKFQPTMAATQLEFNTGKDQISLLIQMKTQFRLVYVNLALCMKCVN